MTVLDLPIARRRRLAIAFIILAVTGCQDVTGPSVPEHTLTFQYSGDITGTFESSGLPSLASPGVLAPTGYVAAISYAAGSSRAGTLSFITQDPRGQQNGDMFLMSRIPATRGTVAVPTASNGTPSALLYVSVLWNASIFQPTRIYALDGTLNVASVSATRVRGTFHGTAHLLTPTGIDSRHAITITNGEFDVPIDDPAVLSFRCGFFVC